MQSLIKTGILCAILITFGVSHSYGQSAEFLDKTGERYKGNEKHLSALKVKSFTIYNLRDYNDKKGNLVIAWKTDDYAERGYTLESYTLNFEVFDRSNKKVFAGSKNWERLVQGRDTLELPLQTLNYGKVLYWISDIDVSNNTQKAANTAVAKAEALTNLERAKASPNQQDACDLSLASICNDYSKNIGYAELKLNTTSDIEKFAKTHNLILDKMNEPTELRYHLYKNLDAKRNGSSLISFYTTKSNLIKYLTWSSDDKSLPVHIEGMKRFLKIPKENYTASLVEVGEGPTSLSQSTIMGITGSRASVGIRPPEIEPGKPTLFWLYKSNKKPKNRYESRKKCEEESAADCEETRVHFDDLVKNYTLIKATPDSTKNSFTYHYKINSGPITRSYIWPTIEWCNKARENYYLTDKEYGWQQQSQCIPWQ